MLSAVSYINPHFVQPVDSAHLEEAQELLVLKNTVMTRFPVMSVPLNDVCSLSALVSQEVLQTIPKFCFPFDTERYDSPPSLLPCFFTTATCAHTRIHSQ